jgi:hypothetical protein
MRDWGRTGARGHERTEEYPDPFQIGSTLTDIAWALGGGGVVIGNQNQPHATGDMGTLVIAAGSPVLCQDPEREAMPVPPSEG